MCFAARLKQAIFDIFIKCADIFHFSCAIGKNLCEWKVRNLLLKMEKIKTASNINNKKSLGLGEGNNRLFQENSVFLERSIISWCAHVDDLDTKSLWLYRKKCKKKWMWKSLLHFKRNMPQKETLGQAQIHDTTLPNIFSNSSILV